MSQQYVRCISVALVPLSAHVAAYFDLHHLVPGPAKGDAFPQLVPAIRLVAMELKRLANNKNKLHAHTVWLARALDRSR